MRPVLSIILLAAAGCTAMAEAPAEPDLAVILVVDQLTPDLLERYDAAWSGGFRRLLDEGRRFEDAAHAHAVTFTSPGHASPITGLVPARHGIVSNSWREWRDGEWVTVSSVADPEARLVGGSGSGSSPHRLLEDGLPDWLLAQRPGARVVSISGKSTAAVLMGGRARSSHVYWFSTGNGGFMTSSWYREELPAWVADFNETVVERFAGEECWEEDLPADVAALSRPDEVEYEGDGEDVAFPHCVHDARYRNAAAFMAQGPGLDRATLALAREAVESLSLGRGEGPDYLAIGLSSTDRVGHQFGPFSREQLDNLVRLDREIGAFLEFLDSTLGEGAHVTVLTSDHGVLPLPEYLVEQGRFGERLSSDLSRAYSDASVQLRNFGAEHGGEDAIRARVELAERLEAIDWVEAAMPLEVLASDAEADSFVVMYRNSFHPERLTGRMATWGVEARLREGGLLTSSGTTHGVPYLHDRRVPFIISGGGMGRGRSAEAVRTVDLAPTLAAILGIDAPEDLDGRTLRP